MGAERQETVKAVAAATESTISHVTRHMRDEVAAVLSDARERALDKGTTVEHEIELVPQVRAKGQLSGSWLAVTSRSSPPGTRILVAAGAPLSRPAEDELRRLPPPHRVNGPGHRRDDCGHDRADEQEAWDRPPCAAAGHLCDPEEDRALEEGGPQARRQQEEDSTATPRKSHFDRVRWGILRAMLWGILRAATRSQSTDSSFGPSEVVAQPSLRETLP